MLAWVLAVLMTIGACSVIQFTNQTLQVSAYAAHTQQEAVNWAISQIGQKLDYDGVYGAQCVDLIKYYYAYLGVSPVTGNGADYPISLYQQDGPDFKTIPDLFRNLVILRFGLVVTVMFLL